MEYIKHGVAHRCAEMQDSLSLMTGLIRRQRVYRQFKQFTMIWPETYRANLAIVERIQSLPGCVVECGVWRGGMIAGIAKVLGVNRQYFLFDSFEGLPPAQDIDGATAKAWQADANSSRYYENCSASPRFATEAMQRAGCSDFRLVKGWFKETLSNFIPPGPIALLRIDGDWYESVMVCLQALFKHVAPGGIIIIDDYYTWDGCAQAVHDFLSQQRAVERIDSFAGVCFIRKRCDR